MIKNPELKFCENCQFVQEEYDSYRKNLKLVDNLTQDKAKKHANMTSVELVLTKFAHRILDQDRSSQLKFDFDNFKEIKQWAEKNNGL